MVKSSSNATTTSHHHNNSHDTQRSDSPILNSLKLQKENKLTDVIFGSVAGFAGKIVEFPFDTIKVRLQTQPIDSANGAKNSSFVKTPGSGAGASSSGTTSIAALRPTGSAAKPLFSGPFDCIKKTLHAEGLSGFYRGISSPLIGSMLENAVLFMTYSQIQGLIKSAQGLSNDAELSMAQLALAGSLSGVAVSFVLTPVELIKCKLQVRDIEAIYQSQPIAVTTSTTLNKRSSLRVNAMHQQVKPSPPFQIFGGNQVFNGIGRASFTPTATMHVARTATYPSTSLQVLLSTLKSKGVPGLYRGHFGTLLRETAGGAAWFGVYEYLSKQLMLYSGYTQKEQLSNVQTIFAGACAGMAYNSALFPADVIKSRQQTQSCGRGFFAIGKELWKGEGYRGFYRGFGVTIARAVPASAVIFWSYETMKRNMTI